MQKFQAYVIRIGDGYLWRKGRRYSRKLAAFDKARLFFRRSDAKQAVQGFDRLTLMQYASNGDIVSVSIGLADDTPR